MAGNGEVQRDRAICDVEAHKTGCTDSEVGQSSAAIGHDKMKSRLFGAGEDTNHQHILGIADVAVYVGAVGGGRVDAPQYPIRGGV